MNNKLIFKAGKVLNKRKYIPKTANIFNLGRTNVNNNNKNPNSN